MMRRLSGVLALGCLLLGLAGLISLPTWAGEGKTKVAGPAVPGRLIVGLRANTTAAGAEGTFAAHGLTVLGQVWGLNAVVVAAPSGEEEATARRLRRDPAVRYAEPDFLAHAFDLQAAPNDPYYTTDQWNLPQINAPAAWDVTTGRVTITIAIIDSGVDLGHPDLASKIVPGYDFINDDDLAQDDEGHGTHVAGIAAAATNNAEGIAGVAWGARIMPVKVLDSSGKGSYSGVAAGIAWAADHGANIINLSLGGSSSSQTLREAVEYAIGKGALVVAAAGNDYAAGSPINYPAAYERVLGVAATDDQDRHASYSSAGHWIDVAAPGGDPTDGSDRDPRHWIMSTMWLPESSHAQPQQSAYRRMAGTSMATPHVAGLAALVWSRHGDWTADQVAWAIESTAVDLGAAGRDPLFGWGRIDALAAVAVQTLQPTPTPIPSNCLAESTHPYEDLSTRVWVVNNPDPAATYTRIHFSRLETEPDYDYVILKDAQGVEVQRLDGFFSGGLWSKPAPSQTVTVQLLTDASVVYWGFCVDQVATAAPPAWERRAALAIPRSRLAVAAVGETLYAIGGEADSAASAANRPTAASDAGPAAPTIISGVVEAYDRDADVWVQKAPMPVGLSNIGAAAIGGRIYVPGGFDGAGGTATLHVYDPTTDAWSVRASLPAARYAGAVVAADDMLYVFGGVGPAGIDDACLRYDPTADAWSACARLPVALAWAAAGAAAGKPYLVGGATSSGAEVQTLYEYDPAQDRWTAQAPMSAPRSGLAVASHDGYLYAVGGGWTSYLPLAERFDPAVNQWQLLDPLGVGRRSLGLAELTGRLYAVGGYNNRYAAVVEAYQPPGPPQYPAIAVAPSALDVRLAPRSTSQHVMTISNTGQAELRFDLYDAETAPDATATYRLPERVVSAAGAVGKAPITAGSRPAETHRIAAGVQESAAISVALLIVTPDPDVSDLVEALAAFPDLTVSVFAITRTPGLAELQAHDVVLTTNNYRWAIAGIDPTLLGNALADYVDGGGKVIVANYGHDYSAWAIGGRFADARYGPFARASQDLHGEVTLGDFRRQHPIMQGVQTLVEKAIHQDPTVLDDATWVASWSDGTPLAAAKRQVVGINLLASLGDGSHKWSGDVPTLLHNAAVWLAAGGRAGNDAAWLSQTPASGSAAPNSSVPVTLTVRAGDLAAGVYSADLWISNNDPRRVQLAIPVTLTVAVDAPELRLYLPIITALLTDE